MGHLTSKSAARTAMMVNVNPSVEDFDETQHVLAYSRKAKLIEMNIDEYSMKRKQFFGEEYDHNGRKKAKLAQKKHSPAKAAKKSKSNLLIRMAKKISPNKALGNNPIGNKKIKENIPSSTNRVYEKQIETLKQSLQTTKEHLQRIEREKMELRNELDQKEDQIRTEVAIEMEERLQETRKKQNEKYEHLRSVMHRQTSKADISVSMNRAGNQLEELMDKIDECEKEMVRMSQDYNKEIEDLIRKKGEDASKIARLEQALKESDEEIRRLQQLKGGQKIDNAEKTTKKSEKHTIETLQRQLRPRKPLGTSTNQPLR